MLETRWFSAQNGRYTVQVCALLERVGLTLDDDLEEIVGIFDGQELVAMAARAGNLLKEFAILPDRQGEDLLATLLTELLKRLFELGYSGSKIYTKPAQAAKFASFGFKQVASAPDAVLLESGAPDVGDFAAGLRQAASGMTEPPARRGCIVINANPFTLGHRYLIEQALMHCDRLILLMVQEERSYFPYAVRKELVERGVADLPGVTVLGGGEYVISAATFPRYFLKQADAAAKTQAQLDIDLFLRHIVPALEVTSRFAGSEPEDPLTAVYNETMHRELPPKGVAFTEIARIEQGNTVISASKVRRAYQSGSLDTVAQMLPPSTLMYLQSTPPTPQ